MSASGPTIRQLKALHGWAKACGFSHDDLHEICGVQSLRDLTVAQAAEILDRLNRDDARGGPSYGRRHNHRRQPLQPGEVRLAGDATTRQRKAVAAILHELGWWRGPATLAGGINGRHQIADLWHDRLDRREASAIINELEQALIKQGPARAARSTNAPTPVRAAPLPRRPSRNRTQGES